MAASMYFGYNLTNMRKIGIDIGGSYIKVVELEKGNLINDFKLSSNKENFFNLLQQYNGQNVGISAAGIIKDRKVLMAPNIPWLESFNTDQAEKDFNVTLFLENDANCAALAEYSVIEEDLLFVAIGTGIGGGIVYKGGLLSQAFMEIGHINVEYPGRICGCGNKGCLETVSSIKSIEKIYREKSGCKDKIDKIIGFVDESKIAQEILDKASMYVGRVIAGLISAFSVKRVVIGGGVVFLDTYFKMIENYVHLFTIPILKDEVVISKSFWLDKAGAVGAALLVLDR